MPLTARVWLLCMVGVVLGRHFSSERLSTIISPLPILASKTEESSWRFVSDDPRVKGAQIDLVIRRGDHVTNLCEIKYSAGEYEIREEEAVHLREKVAAFIRETGTNDTCHLTFVTTYGLKRTKASCVVQSEVTLDDLFKE